MPLMRVNLMALAVAWAAGAAQRGNDSRQFWIRPRAWPARSGISRGRAEQPAARPV